MTDCIILRRDVRINQTTYYVWNRYNRNTVTTYRWNRYNVVETTIYNWNRYNLDTENIYRWNKYNIELYVFGNESISNKIKSESDTLYALNLYDNSIPVSSVGTIKGYILSYNIFDDEHLRSYHRPTTDNKFKYPPSNSCYKTFNVSLNDTGNEINLQFNGLVDFDKEFLIEESHIFYKTTGNVVDTYSYIIDNVDNDDKFCVQIDNIYDDYNDKADSYYGMYVALLCSEQAYGLDTGVTNDGRAYICGTNSNYRYGINSRIILLNIFPELTTTTTSGIGRKKIVSIKNSYEIDIYEIKKYSDVTSRNISAYPMDGFDPDNESSNYYYKYTGYEESIIRGTFDQSISSTSSSTYPQDGVQGDYWYTYTGTTTEYTQGSANGSVTSTNRTQYPDNGRSGSYWYVYSSSSVSYSQGSYIDQVTSTNRNQYPDNNYQDNYWYVYQGTSLTAGTLAAHSLIGGV